MLCSSSLSSPLTGAEQLRFRGKKKGHSLTGSAVVVQFGKFFPAKWAQAASVTVDEEMTIPYADLIHATVALLHDSLLPHLPPQQIFQQLCHERARTLVVLRDFEETQRDLLKSSQRLETLNNNVNPTQSQMMRSLRVGSVGKPWQKIVPSLSAGSDGNGLSGPASISSPDDEKSHECDHSAQAGSGTSDATQSPVDDRQWISWATMNRRNKEEILNECGSICSDHPYSDICGDDDSSDDDESIPEDENEVSETGGAPQFARSLEAYVKTVQQRKRDRVVGAESRLVACATFSKDYRQSGAKIVILSHIAVRKKFRRYGIGSFMLKRIKSPSLVGPYDAITLRVQSGEVPVVPQFSMTDASINAFSNASTVGGHPATKPRAQHSCLAPHKQVAFFEKNSFTCDIILNSRFREEDFSIKTGDVLLCYLPPFDNASPYQHLPASNLNTIGHQQQQTVMSVTPVQQLQQRNDSIKAMHEEAQKWREKSLEAYQVQMSYMARLQQEVMRLHEMLGKQETTIEQLRRENSRLTGRLVKAEKKTAKALIENLDKEAADFEKMCSSRKIATGTAGGAAYTIMPSVANVLHAHGVSHTIQQMSSP